MNDGLVRQEDQPLCFRFTATASLRLAPAPREHLRAPSDFADWLMAVGLGTEAPRVDEDVLSDARALRESIYRAARSIANGERPLDGDRDRINEWAARQDAVRVLGDAGAGWRFPGPSAARSALAVLATDAVNTLGAAGAGAIKVCSGVGCVAVFLDTSRGRSRRWCSMATCGNRAKKNAMRIRHDS